MKFFVPVLFALYLTLCPAFSETVATTVSSLNINGADYYDIKILPVPSGDILLPVKQITKIFNLPSEINHSQKEISFTNFEDEKVTVNKNGVFLNNSKISVGQKFLKDGIIEINEFYIDKNLAGKIFNSEFSVDTNTLSTEVKNKFDKEDVRVSGVPVAVSWQSHTLKTKRSGFCPLQCVDKGYYEVKLDGDNLHTNLSPLNNLKQAIYVEPMKTTRVEFPLKSSVGNISGKLNIVDDFNRNMQVTDFIISLFDTEGKEVAYSTVDASGGYYFSGISPGKYKIALDNNFVNDYNLIPDTKKGEIAVDIPYVYKEFVELNIQDLIYKCY